MLDKNILFTTIDGYIGSNIYKQFYKNKNCFFLTDKVDRINKADRIYFYKDLPVLLSKQGIDIVFNNRGVIVGDNKNMHSINYTDNKKLFSAMVKKNIKLFINLDTNRVFNHDKVPRSIIDMGKGSGYYASKEKFRNFLKELKTNTRIVNIYCDIVYGPGDKLHKFVNKITVKIIEDRDSVVIKNSKLIRNFVYIDDFVDFVKKLLSSNAKIRKNYTECFVVSKRFHTLSQLTKKIKKIANSRCEIISNNVANYAITNSLLIKEFDINKNPSWLKWKPKTSLDKGLNEVVESSKSES